MQRGFGLQLTLVDGSFAVSEVLKERERKKEEKAAINVRISTL